MELSHSVVSAIVSDPLPLPQEAALLYAHGRVCDAARAIESGIEPGAAHELDAHAWFMLFDLYRAEGQWQEYESLVARFENLFGRGAPPWSNQEETAHLPPEMQSGGRACFELIGALDTDSANLLDRMRARAGTHSALRLDLSKVTNVDATGCARLSEVLATLTTGEVGLLVTGVDRVVHLLHTAAHGNPGVRAYWILLLALYRLRGMQQEFERAALEYALTTEESPPAWEPPLTPLAAPRVIDEKRDEPRYQSGPDVIHLNGVMTGATDPQLDALSEFSHQREYVNVNLSRLTRADFTCATELATRINGLAQAGKTVRLLRPNALVGALLGSFPLSPGVTVVPTGYA